MTAVGLPLPALDLLVEAADAGLHSWVRQQVPEQVRKGALEEELGFWLNTAAQDLDYAAAYAASAPYSGEPSTAYLDQWLPLPGVDGHVLAGPRYRGMDPNRPFVGISASDRPLERADRRALTEVARRFRAFRPGFVVVMTADPVDSWPGTRHDRRLVIGRLGDLRDQPVPPELTTTARTDTAFYDRYAETHAWQVAREPRHALHARGETEEDLQALADQGLLFDVRVDREWAGVLAAEPGVQRGARGVVVVELLLAHEFRGHGFGKHLSTLLARAVPQADDERLLGTIHADNTPAYQSALAAGRCDVGGEIWIPL